jgi:hypothetical protein
MAGPKEKGSRAYREGYRLGSRKKTTFYNPFTKSGKKRLKTEFEARGGWDDLNPLNAFGLSSKKTIHTTKQYNKGIKAGAKEYYAKKKKKDSSVKLAKKYFRGGLV